MNNNIHNIIECPVCPACGSRNIQTEGLLHVCLDCGNKWEDAPDGDLGEIVIYQSDEGVRLDVRLESNTVWLNQDQIVSLFNKSKSTISEHISNIFKEGELDEQVVVRKFRTTTPVQNIIALLYIKLQTQLIGRFLDTLIGWNQFTIL